MENHQTVDFPQKGTLGWWAAVWCTSTIFKLQILTFQILTLCRTGSVQKMCQHHFLELKQDAIMQHCWPKEMKGGVVEKALDLKSVHKCNNLNPIIQENEVQK